MQAPVALSATHGDGTVGAAHVHWDRITARGSPTRSGTLASPRPLSSVSCLPPVPATHIVSASADGPSRARLLFAFGAGLEPTFAPADEADVQKHDSKLLRLSTTDAAISPFARLCLDAARTGAGADCTSTAHTDAWIFVDCEATWQPHLRHSFMQSRGTTAAYCIRQWGTKHTQLTQHTYCADGAATTLLLSLSPAAIDAEIRMLSGESVDQMRAVLQFLLAALESNAHFEILQAVLSVLLKARHRHPPLRNARAMYAHARI